VRPLRSFLLIALVLGPGDCRRGHPKGTAEDLVQLAAELVGGLLTITTPMIPSTIATAPRTRPAAAMPARDDVVLVRRISLPQLMALRVLDGQETALGTRR
jgi:hypothetical protein